MTNQKVFNLTFARHGQTVANVQKIIQGHTDTPLTELGIEQAKLLGKFISSLGHDHFDKIFSSDQERAILTSRVIAASIGFSESSIIEDRRLRERKYGKYEGRPIREFQLESYDHGYNEYNFTHYTPDGVESMDQVKERVRDFLQTLCQACVGGEEILVVSHWATIKELLKVFLPLSNGAITKYHIVESPNSAISKVKIRCATSDPYATDDNFIASVEVIYLHQTPHLMDDQTSVNIGHLLE